ncbi:hypothetical protein ABZW03_27770 [Kitasatospora sp. NPDC004799]|uniref:hypothetical protein n=1 Tax=Kitasatospora sp. NPDC004799 TaxID=3154460 RepID=UPI0033B1C8F6
MHPAGVERGGQAAENETGADDFYVVGAVALGGKTHAVLTTPVQIDDGQERAFPSDQRVVFNGPAADADTLHLGLAAYNEDGNRDWKKRGSAADKITAAVGALPVPSGALLVSAACTAADAVLGRIDTNDRLGQLTLDVRVEDLQPGADRRWSCSSKPGEIRTWQYEVYYAVEKS